MSDYLTVDQAAANLGVHPRTITRAIKSGELRAFQIGKPDAKKGTWRIHPDDLQAWLDQRANTPRQSSPSPLPVVPFVPAPASRPRSPRRRAAGHLVVAEGMGR